MKFISYNRQAVTDYAQQWALSRNPQYYNFDGIGGDCTNFASQCLYAGCGVMNYKKDIGWYYNSINDRAAAWSSVEHFRKFLLTNSDAGPSAVIISMADLELGDFIQLNSGTQYYHTLVVTGFSNNAPLVSSHTDDSYMRNLNTYRYHTASALHIIGASKP